MQDRATIEYCSNNRL